MKKIRVSVVGGSGYTGGELIRLLLFHPNVEINQITSESNAGKYIYKLHPNLRKVTQLKFSSIDDLEKTDLLFLALPHGISMKSIERFTGLAPRIIDLSGDFRLNDASLFEEYYGVKHSNPKLLGKFVYGIPELHMEEMRKSNYISSAGCNATATILALYPFFKHNLVKNNEVYGEIKAGSSEGGNKSCDASHHPERSHVVRSYAPTKHRHIAEMIQELDFNARPTMHISLTAVELVRGILGTYHIILNKKMTEKDIWQLLREEYSDKPFIRIVKESSGIYRFPEPKILAGSNYCDIGFELDHDTNRLVIISAIDNLMKGAAGQAIQAFNIMNGFDERTGLEFPGLHPI